MLLLGRGKVYANVMRWLVEDRSSVSSRVQERFLEGYIKALKVYEEVRERGGANVNSNGVVIGFDKAVTETIAFYEQVARTAQSSRDRYQGGRWLDDQDHRLNVKQLKKYKKDEPSGSGWLASDALSPTIACVQDSSTCTEEEMAPIGEIVEDTDLGSEYVTNKTWGRKIASDEYEKMAKFVYRVVNGHCVDHSDICASLCQVLLGLQPFGTLPVFLSRSPPMRRVKEQMNALCGSSASDEEFLTEMMRAFSASTQADISKALLGSAVVYVDGDMMLSSSTATVEDTEVYGVGTISVRATEQAIFMELFSNKGGVAIVGEGDKKKVMELCLREPTTRVIDKLSQVACLKIFMDKITGGQQEKLRPGLLTQFTDAHSMGRVLSVREDDDINKSTAQDSIYDLPTIYQHPTTGRRLKKAEDPHTGLSYIWTNFTTAIPTPVKLYEDSQVVSTIVVSPGKGNRDGIGSYVDKSAIDALVQCSPRGVSVTDILRSLVNGGKHTNEDQRYTDDVPTSIYRELWETSMDDEEEATTVEVDRIRAMFVEEDQKRAFADTEVYVSVGKKTTSGYEILYNKRDKAFVPSSAKIEERDKNFFQRLNKHLVEHPVESMDTYEVKSILSFDFDFIDLYRFTNSPSLNKIRFAHEKIDSETKAMLAKVYNKTRACNYKTKAQNEDTLFFDWVATCTNYDMTTEDITAASSPPYEKMFVQSKNGFYYTTQFFDARDPTVYEFSPMQFAVRNDLVAGFSWKHEGFDIGRLKDNELFADNRDVIALRAAKCSKNSENTKRFVRENMDTLGAVEYRDGMNGAWFSVFNDDHEATGVMDALCNKLLLQEGGAKGKKTAPKWGAEYVQLFKTMVPRQCTISSANYTCCFVQEAGMVAFVGHDESASWEDMAERYFEYNAIYEAGLVIADGMLVLGVSDKMDVSPRKAVVYPQRQFTWPHPHSSSETSIRRLLTTWKDENTLNSTDVKTLIQDLTLVRERYIRECNPVLEPNTMLFIGKSEDDEHVPNTLPKSVTLRWSKKGSKTGVFKASTRNELVSVLNKKYK